MKTRRILATILTVLLFLSGGFLLSCSACQENTLPPNLKSYQELLDQYKPSDADLEKSLSDFSADAYAPITSSCCATATASIFRGRPKRSG